MPVDTQRIREFASLVRSPRDLARHARSNIELWANLFIIGWAIAFMFWQGFGFAVIIGTVFAIWAILSVSLNLVVGFTGLLSVGHIGFFGIGAYTMAILTSDPAYEQLRTEAIPTFGWPFFAVLPLCALVAGVAAILVGVVFNRFRDDIFVLVSFGFAIIAFNVFLNLRPVTRGAFGIHEIARPQVAGWVIDGELEFLLMCLLFLAVVMLISWFIVSSSFGRVLTAIREDEQAIEVFGYQATHYKLAVWVISAMMAGIAGGLFASWTTFIDPNSFILLESVLLVSIVILGGLATIWGSLLGAMASSCWRRACGSFRSCPPSTSARPARSSSASCWCCSCCSGPRDSSGGIAYDIDAIRPHRLRPGDPGHLQALRRSPRRRRVEPVHPAPGHHQHRRTQRLRQVHPWSTCSAASCPWTAAWSSSTAPASASSRRTRPPTTA